MKRLLFRLIALFSLLVLPMRPVIGAGQSQPLTKQQAEQRSAERWMLHFSSSIVADEKKQLLAEYGLLPTRYLAQIEVWVVDAAAPLTAQQIDRLEADQSVDWIERDGLLHASETTPNDNFYQAQQQNLRVIGCPQAWDYSRGVTDWPIAIIDSGIDLDHPDLTNKVWVNADEIPGNGIDDDGNGYIDDVNGWNFVTGNANIQDNYWHGSHVAGIAAAETNNGIGIAGVAWDTPVMPVKVLNSNGSGDADDVAAGILYAVDNGARILNLSLGASTEYQTITAAVIYAQGKGALVVAAAGNAGGAVDYPAAQPEALAVSATDNLDLPWSYTNRGPEVDLAAPGVNIFSANNNGSYNTATGTSLSTPQVSGVAALIWNLRPEWTVIQVSQVLTSTAQDVWAHGRDDMTGWGRLDASAAIDASLWVYYFPLLKYEVDVPPEY